MKQTSTTTTTTKQTATTKRFVVAWKSAREKVDANELACALI